MNRRVLIGQKINCKDGLENFKQGDMLKKGERKVAEVSQIERNSWEGEMFISHVPETTV